MYIQYLMCCRHIIKCQWLCRSYSNKHRNNVGQLKKMHHMSRRSVILQLVRHVQHGRKAPPSRPNGKFRTACIWLCAHKPDTHFMNISSWARMISCSHSHPQCWIIHLIIKVALCGVWWCVLHNLWTPQCVCGFKGHTIFFRPPS